MIRNYGDLSKLNRPIFGVFISIPDPSLVEMAYNAGFGFIRIDMEHCLFSYERIAELIRTASLLKMPCQVRISSITDVTKLLDFGVDAIICPNIETIEEVKSIIKQVKYYPLGKRGMYPISRFAKFGLEHFDNYLETANDYVAVGVQLENLVAIKNIDVIANLEGLDMLASGRQDLAQSMGLIGQPSHSKVIEMENLIVKKAIENGKIPTLMVDSKKRAQELFDMGVKHMTIGIDTNLIAKCFLNTVNSML